MFNHIYSEFKMWLLDKIGKHPSECEHYIEDLISCLKPYVSWSPPTADK